MGRAEKCQRAGEVEKEGREGKRKEDPGEREGEPEGLVDPELRAERSHWSKFFKLEQGF